MSAALLAYRYPGLSGFAAAHVFEEVAAPIGRHAVPGKRHRLRRPGWLRRRKHADTSAPWWWCPGDPENLLAVKPITRGTHVTLPMRLADAVPAARTAGKPPWEAITVIDMCGRIGLPQRKQATS